MGVLFGESKIDEKKIIKPKIKGISDYISFEKLSIIERQKEYNVCKITKNNKGIGTGFLCLIPYPDRINLLPALITCNHVLNEDDIKEGKEINLIFNDKINKKLKIEKSRVIYTSDKNEYDTTIIEIKKTDDFYNNNMLEIDYDIYQEGQLANLYKNKSIYIIHYPNGNISSFSDNIIKNIHQNNIIEHLCSTQGGSSGAPILNLTNFKVIGVHRGSLPLKYINFGVIISAPIDKFNLKNNKKKFQKQSQIIITIHIDKNNIGKKVYFLEDYEFIKEIYLEDITNNTIINAKKFGKESLENKISKNKEEFLKSFPEHLKELNKTNVKLYIEDTEFEYKKWFIPEKEGKHIIKLVLNCEMKDCSYMFCGCRNILEIDFSFFDTKNVINMNSMFKYCSSLKYINLSSFNTSKVCDMSEMFCNCISLYNLDISTFDTKNVTNMNGMFADCRNLLYADLSSFETKNVTNMTNMFYNCEKIRDIELPFFDTKNVTDMSKMFSYCKKIKELDLSSFNIGKNTNILELFESCDKLRTIKINKNSKRIKKENKNTKIEVVVVN